jgi:hypothetical protein
MLRAPTVVELSGARHEVPWVNPERLVDEIEGFIRS